MSRERRISQPVPTASQVHVDAPRGPWYTLILEEGVDVSGIAWIAAEVGITDENTVEKRGVCR